MKAQVDYQDQPLQHLKLEGLHLIEASAGTGKTWTLSSLMVRILTEKYMPRQVVATTFTRAAAAELKSRIRHRLTDIYHLALQWQQLSPVDYSQQLSTLKDPLAQLLFTRFQHAEDDRQNFDYLVNRLKLVIDSLDELFVGTIDSFTQKLLREFSFESGEIMPRQISEDEQQYPYQIVHDVLRAWLQQQPQSLVDLLLLSQSLASMDSYIATVQKTLNFSRAKLQPIDCPQIDLAQFEQLLAQFKDCDFTAIEDLADYYQVDGQYIKEWNGSNWRKGVLQKLFTETLPALQHELRLSNRSVLFDKSALDAFERLLKIANAYGVKNPQSAPMQAFYQHPLIQLLCQCASILDCTRTQLQTLDQYLRYYLCVEVKSRLPQVLLQAGETTFNQQISTLSDALSDERGQRLAQAIRQRYPIILVDEFQDTNQEQDNMLHAIWRDHQHLSQSCFIAVGDPKQAIYGFRGGDILTYINAFNDIAGKQGCFYRLRDNFRSIPSLVQAVDALFQRQIQFGEDIEYYAANTGLNDDAPLIENGEKDTQPLRWIELNAEQNPNEAYLIAHKIRYLLAQAQQGQLYIEKSVAQKHQNDSDNVKHIITAEDIAVLAASNFELDQIQRQLEALHIRVNRTTQNSVFASQAAQDMGALLQAMMLPEQDAILKRALLTPAIGLTLADFCQFETDAELINTHVQYFRFARQTWLQKGFLIAWEWLAAQYRIWQNLAKNSGVDSERHIVNTRHLVEVLSQHSRHYASLQHLIQWYALQLGSPAQREWELERKLSSESGVQLMTIHKSKGLEFKIVFLMHTNKEVKFKNDGLAFYQEQNTNEAAEQNQNKNQAQPNRVIAISSSQIEDNPAALQAHQDKLLGENRRLWYVAFTRASYRIYAVLQHQKTAAKFAGGAAFWLNAKAEPFAHQAVMLEDAVSPQMHYQHQLETPARLYAIPYPSQQFYPKSRTSFSYLAAHLKQQQAIDALAAFEQHNGAAEDESITLTFSEHSHVEDLQNAEHDILTEQQSPLDWIRIHFPRGTLAGNCLHEIFEVIDFQDQTLWDKEIYKQLNHYSLWSVLIESYQQQYPAGEQDLTAIRSSLVALIKTWLQQIVATPILSDSQFCLKDLDATQRLSEFPFYLALSDKRFNSQAIHALFLDYGIAMPEFESANTARYLNGAIDLVFFDGQRYQIADYKSNYLGDSLADYAVENIEYSMSMASYWLQASLYLVALHRYLKNNLAAYQPEQHLGAANYLYLRGMTGKQSMEMEFNPLKHDVKKCYGVKSWQPDLQLILDLDILLGTTEQYQPVDNSV